MELIQWIVICTLDSSVNFWITRGWWENPFLSVAANLLLLYFCQLGAKNHVEKLFTKIITPQVNFAGVNTNLVAMCSRCIRFVSLSTTRVEAQAHTRSDKKVMLTFVWRQRIHATTLPEKEKNETNNWNKQKKVQPSQRWRYIAGNPESFSISSCVSAHIQSNNSYFSLLPSVFVQDGRRAKRC